MQTIHKIVSLEPLITRFPVCYPSIVDDNVTYYSSDNIETVKNAFYGYIPLGVNESVCGSYSAFTSEMKQAYSGSTLDIYGLTLDCYTLQKWMNEFKDYYSLLRSSECRGVPFSSVTQYYQSAYGNDYDEVVAQEMDDDFKKHGGDKFYKWLLNNYFITLDFLGEYQSVSASCTYYEWQEYIDSVGTNYMTYPDVLRFEGKMNAWDILYYNKDCSDFETCCDCVDYKHYGGHTMSQLLKSWINRINTNINSINSAISGLTEENRYKLMPKTGITFQIKTKIEDLGSYVEFTKEFEPGVTYVSGNTCSYDGNVYLFTGTTYNELEFNVENGWIPYYDAQNHNDFEYTGIKSGRTISNLETLIRKDLLVDTMGNTLPGHYEPYSGSTFSQPPENTLLDFMYKPGTYANIERWQYANSQQIYICDYLDHIKFYYKDINGNLIESTVIEAYFGENVNDRIQHCINTLEDIPDDVYVDDSIIYADFYTYRATPVCFNSNGRPIKYTTYGGNLQCIDHCTIQRMSCLYSLSDNESYPVEYYGVNLDVEKQYSEELEGEIDVAICDFSLDISDYDKTYVESPLFRKEELLPFSIVESPVDNIYINRGYATVLDKHLRIGEINDCEQIELYGNGIFQIFDVDKTNLE